MRDRVLHKGFVAGQHLPCASRSPLLYSLECALRTGLLREGDAHRTRNSFPLASTTVQSQVHDSFAVVSKATPGMERAMKALSNHVPRRTHLTPRQNPMDKPTVPVVLKFFTSLFGIWNPPSILHFFPSNWSILTPPRRACFCHRFAQQRINPSSPVRRSPSEGSGSCRPGYRTVDQSLRPSFDHA